MTDITATAYGALFGPDFVIVTVNDDTGLQYQLQVYPDANNLGLKQANLATQYYFQPARVYLAKKQDSPADFDFGMTVFKGLMTAEDTLGVAALPTTGGSSEAGGGFCTFSTTFGIPPSVIANALTAIKAHDHPTPPPSLANLFNFATNDPDPLLGIVPITDNQVVISIPDLSKVGGPSTPMWIEAQGSGKGSIEAQGYSSFLITCNQMAAGAISGSLQDGQVPFTVSATLKEQFYINGANITVTADADKCFDQMSAALSVGGFAGIGDASLSAAYSNMVTSGAITTVMQMNEGVMSDDMKKMIEQDCDDMRKAAFDSIKSVIFDWQPTVDPPATANRSLFSSIFGGASVSMKSDYQRRSLKFTQNLTLNNTISLSNTISGDLTDLEPAVKANLSKYLAIVDIGQFFQKIQVAGMSSINFSEILPDGTNLSDPIKSVQMQVSYPNFDNPVGANNSPNLSTQADGFHYTIGQVTPGAAGELAIWTAQNPNDIINVSFLRLANDLANWPADQVQIATTIIYDPDDPRVDLSNGGTTITQTNTGKNHAPTITPEQVGYLFVRFTPFPMLPKDNIVMTITTTFGTRSDTITINRANQKNCFWEIFSDKYEAVTSFSYTVQVEVSGPDFTDPVIQWQSPAPIVVEVPAGRLKYINPLTVTIPPAPAGQAATINQYIRNYQD